MQKGWYSLCVLILVSFAFGQQTTLDQAVQVVRDWLGDPQAVVEFMFEEDESTAVDLTGPRNSYEFWTGPYIVTVNIDRMRVEGWIIHLPDYVHDARTDLPVLSEDQIRDIAFNYTQQHFPYFTEFPNWEITPVEKDLLKNRDETGQVIKEAWAYRVQLNPYFINGAGQKIPVLSTYCIVNVDPYTGNIIGFRYNYTPVTLTNLLPNFSAEEAKTRIEQAFLALGAAQANAVMSSPDPPYDVIPDGLVIGATGTSGLRLAYAFDYVVTVGAPGHENEFGDEIEPALFRASIDAHTGEPFHIEYYMGSAGTKEALTLLKGSRREESKPHSFPEIWQRRWGISIGVLIMGFLFLLLARRRRRRSAMPA